MREKPALVLLGHKRQPCGTAADANQAGCGGRRSPARHGISRVYDPVVECGARRVGSIRPQFRGKARHLRTFLRPRVLARSTRNRADKSAADFGSSPRAFSWNSPFRDCEKINRSRHACNAQPPASAGGCESRSFWRTRRAGGPPGFLSHSLHVGDPAQSQRTPQWARTRVRRRSPGRRVRSSPESR